MGMRTLSAFVFFFLISTVCAYYGDPYDSVKVPAKYCGGSAAIGDKMYIFGGDFPSEISDEAHAQDILALGFTPNGTLEIDYITPQGDLDCFPCAGYALPEENKIVVVNSKYPEMNITGTNITVQPNGLAIYDIANNSWTHPQGPTQNSNATYLNLPNQRGAFLSAISPQSDFIYLMGGVMVYYDNDEEVDEPTADIYRFDLKNMSSVLNLTSENPDLNLPNIGGSADMLPNGVIVVAFGYDNTNDIMYPTNQVTLYDTTRDIIYTQNISGTPPQARVSAKSVLGPDKTTIYYYGGGTDPNVIYDMYRGDPANGIAILDTKSWSWVDVPITGPPPLPFADGTLTLFQNSKLVTATGKIADLFADDIGVLINLPTSDDNVQSSKFQWYTNDPEVDQASLRSGKSGLSDGAVAGIVIACLLIVAIALALLWKYVPSTKNVLSYIQNEMIWNPRSGEPLWAETTRLLVRFILLFLFLAFIVYVIYKSINSPIVIQKIRTDTDKVLAPDIRFCFDGFGGAPEDRYIVCRFRNGTDCSQYVQRLDLQVHSPVYVDSLGAVDCFLFLPGPSFYIIDDKRGYQDSTGTKISFSLFAPPTPNITDAVIYADMYAPEYDPNTYAYNLLNETIVNKLDRPAIRQWSVSEQTFNLVDSIIVKQSVRSTASYTLIQNEELKINEGWNYIGFSSTYDTSLQVTTQYKDAPQNPALIEPGHYIAQLIVQPSSFTINIDRQQKVFTLLNAFAQAGGVLGLFIGLQTILFGFRPQSPWGIVHRWSFGSLRTKLTDRLANYFDRIGTPVPLVSPVNTRLGTLFRNNGTYGPPGRNVPSAAEEAMSQENRVQQVEERLQLMELLLKSYYLNDEVFRSLHQAVERGNEEKRRSSIGGIKPIQTDSVLEEGHVDESFESSSNGYRKNDNTTRDTERRPTDPLFNQPRDVYQPHLVSSDMLDFRNDETTFPKK